MRHRNGTDTLLKETVRTHFWDSVRFKSVSVPFVIKKAALKKAALKLNLKYKNKGTCCQSLMLNYRLLDGSENVFVFFVEHMDLNTVAFFHNRSFYRPFMDLLEHSLFRQARASSFDIFI